MEITANAVQTVGANQNVLYTDIAVAGNCSMLYRSGSGVVKLRGLTRQCRARFKVSFNGNVAVPTGGTIDPVTFAITEDGETIGYSTMIVTPAAVGEYFNISSTVFIDVPAGCCTTVAVSNIGVEATVQNANLIIERVA